MGVGVGVAGWGAVAEGSASTIGLYKIFVHFKAFLHESIITFIPPPTCNAHTIAILLHDYCAIYKPLPTSRLHAMHHTLLVMAISCKGQIYNRLQG